MDSFSNIKICQMSQEDIDSIKEIFSSDFDEFWSYETLAQDFKCSDSTYLACKTESDIVVGFIGLKIVLDNADIMDIAVKKEYRNHGIGSLLLKQAILVSTCKNCNQIMLEVNSTNSPAIALYEKFCFQKISVRKKYYNQKDDAIIMQKIL